MWSIMRSTFSCVRNAKEVPLGTNTSVNIVDFDENLKPTIILENYIGHLD